MHGLRQFSRLKMHIYIYIYICIYIYVEDSSLSVVVPSSLAIDSQHAFRTKGIATRLSSITTATTGQTTIDSGTQLDLLMMGIKMPETC